jgi:serine/threonine protein kinase
VHRAAVIIVGTHVDRLSRDDRPKLKELLQEINEFYNIPTYTPGCLHGLRWTPPLGFPCVMANVAVSCSTRDGINQLRDVIYEASTAFKEGGMDDSGPIANRGRYVLTQLYPASYLWLEDKVRNMVMDYRWTNRPPVLTTKEFMEEIFRDVNNMFVGDSAKEDLEKAVRFLCASGTLVHQEDPLLADLFFIDPQWLCDLFAHVVTIRDVNAFIHKDSGIMLKKDMEQVFRDNEFPIKWKEEYIRLMTIFEVVVEIDDSQLLIPSHVKDDSLENPFLSLSGGLHSLPPHHHIIFLPHIPSGFWVRLISRILGDLSIVSMVTTGFGAKKVKNFFGRNLPFSWCLVQRGIMLQYEDYPVLTVRELPGQQIFQVPNCSSVHYLGEENLTRKWKEMKNKPHNAIEVIVTDLYPLLMLEEVHYAYQKKDLEGLLQFPFVEFASTLDGEPQVASPPPNPLASSGTMPQVKLTLPRVILEDGQHLTTEVVITRNPRVRMHTRRKKQSTPGAVVLVEATSSTGSQSMDVIDEDGPVMRSRSRGFSSEGSFTRPKKPLPNLAKRAPSKKEQAKQSFFKNTEQSATAQPSLKEEMYDIKRAAVFSQILDHIRSIWEDWYPKLRSGMPTKTEEERVPCPFCWEDRPSGQQRILRSFSSHSEVNDGVKLLVKSTGDCEFLTPPPPTPSLEKPNLEEVPSDLVGSGTPSWEEPNHFLFNFYHYLEVAPSPSVCYCPRHHTMPSQYVIPNMTFQRVSCDIIADVKELELVSQIDKGSFATVEKRLWKQNKAGQTTRTEVAMKVMKCSGDRSKYHIMLEKELTIINDLHHVNIIRCLGVVLQPLSALLELAPMGNLRSIYLQYFSEDLLIPLRVVHKTLIDITSALEYLHSKKVIYRDLKASNVLVWRYVLPGQQLPHGDESILGDEVIHVKLSDFNISAVVPIVEKIHHPIGTPGFIAPELANYKHGLYTSKVDIFSLGSLIYELITCQQPFEREGEVSLLYKGLRPCLYKKHRVFPVLLLELMYWCWEMRVDVRPTASDVLAALESDQCMRLLMGVDIHDKMYPRSAVLWWGEPSNQEDELGPLPQQTTTDDATSRPANRPIHRLWVACGDFYSSYLTILDYDRGHFTAIQDISSGASSVLCMAVVGGTVWVGFEHGYLMVYDAATKCPSAQLWPKGRALVVQAIAHVPAFNSVYLGFGNGFVWSVPDVIAEDTVGMVTCALTPEKEFEDLTKTASTLLPVPVGGAKQYELWVGQNDRTIAILELPSLEVKDYLTISESQDSSTLPCYLSDVFVGHLVLEELSLQGQQEALESQNSFVYSSLFLGQVVIRWSANGRKDLASYNITSCSEVQQTGKVGVWINSLHGNSHHVYIGLTTGDIIILKAGTLMELATLSCHAQQVRCLVTMPTPPMNEGVADGRGKDHAHPVRLASCGLGFKSYYSPKPVDPAHKSLPEALEPAKLFLWNVSHI